MAVRVVTGPVPIVTPADVPGGHAADDATMIALIAAVQASIDGPTGWLGRSLGEQTLELTRAGFRRSIRLPYLPVTDIVSVKYRDEDDAEQTVDPANYRLAANTAVFAPTFALPKTQCSSEDAVTIQYEAGYATDDVPASAKRAVILGVQHLNSMAEQSLFLRSEEVEGIGTKTFTVGDGATEAVKAATEYLVGWLKVRTV